MTPWPLPSVSYKVNPAVLFSCCFQPNTSLFLFVFSFQPASLLWCACLVWTQDVMPLAWLLRECCRPNYVCVISKLWLRRQETIKRSVVFLFSGRNRQTIEEENKYKRRKSPQCLQIYTYFFVGFLKHLSMDAVRQTDRKKTEEKKRRSKETELEGKRWNAWPHGLVGNPPLSWEPCALVARWNVLSAGSRTLSFK